MVERVSDLATRPSYAIPGPAGETLSIPRDLGEDFAYFAVDEADAIRRYYDENGYVVVRGVVPAHLCDRALETFRSEVKPYEGFIYRQASANPERHALTPEGFMLNSLLNIQSLPTRRFAGFKRAGLAILAHGAMQTLCRILFDEPGKLVQSMFFEGNPVTWAHQDTYYLDAEKMGRMAAAWFAVEDIAPGAGRFFVYPESQTIDMEKNGGSLDIAFHHQRYKELVIDVIRRHRLQCSAPALRKGDVLLWSSKTIHGSLATTEPHRSRASFTAHYVPRSMGLKQFQARIRPLSLKTVNGLEIHVPKDLDKPLPRAIFAVETNFPRSFQRAKRLAIKVLTR